MRTSNFAYTKCARKVRVTHTVIMFYPSRPYLSHVGIEAHGFWNAKTTRSRGSSCSLPCAAGDDARFILQLDFVNLVRLRQVISDDYVSQNTLRKFLDTNPNLPAG